MEDLIYHPPLTLQPSCWCFPPEDETDKYTVLPYFWMPEDNIDLRVRRDHVQYDLWEKQGHILTTEGNVVHYGYIEKFIEELGEKYNIREIAFDRWGAVQMVQNLEGLGFTVVPFGQGFKDMSPPTKELIETDIRRKNSTRRASSTTVDDGQHLYKNRSGWKYKTGQGKKYRKNRWSSGNYYGTRPRHPLWVR
jgi:hypothetical protein